MSDTAIVVVDCLVWASWSVLVGLAAPRLPDRLLARDLWLTRIRDGERSGRVYERIRIRSWKDRLPDAGTWLGGRSKRSVGGRTNASLERFVIETRRAEVVHWAVLAAAPAFVLWNPPGLFVAMLVYGTAANVPCILIQRYNRARLERILHRRRQRIGAAGERGGA